MISFDRTLRDKIERFGVTELSARSGVSKMQIHRILNGSSSPTLQTLGQLLAVLGYQLELRPASEQERFLESDEQLKSALAHYGAPLIISGQFDPVEWPSISLTTLRAIERGRWHADINAILPFFLHLHCQDLNFQSLATLTSEPRYFAYLMTILFRLTNEHVYFEQIQSFPRVKSSQKQEPLMHGELTKQQQYRLTLSNNPIAKLWGFVTLDSIDSIAARFQKWTNANIYPQRT